MFPLLAVEGLCLISRDGKQPSQKVFKVPLAFCYFVELVRKGYLILWIREYLHKELCLVAGTGNKFYFRFA